MKVTIGRTSGPCIDKCVSSDFDGEKIEVVKDVLAMVNRVTNEKDGWWVRIGDEQTHTIPHL